MSFDPVVLPEGRSFVMRPVLAGVARMSDMQNCTYDLYDVQMMNDALDADAENQRRAQEAMKDK